MSVESVILKAESLVIRTETEYINELRMDIEKAQVEGRINEADIMINELIKEGKRVHKKPLMEYDEEEIRVFNLIRNRKAK